MRISKYIHSCILVENKDERLLIDPGLFSFIEGRVKPEDFRGISTILITHAHADHYDIKALKVILKNNSGAKVFANAHMAEILKNGGLTPEVFEAGERTFGTFTIKAFFAEHEALPAPLPPNTAFLINETFLHPGDSLSETILQVPAEIIALPVAAPWLTIVGTLGFAGRYKPKQVVPVHDGFIKDFFTERFYPIWETQLKKQNITFHSLENPGDFVEV